MWPGRLFAIIKPKHRGGARRTERQEKLEAMLEAICLQERQTAEKLARLKAEGKTKTVTYRQLFANKLNLMNLLDRFALYGE